MTSRPVLPSPSPRRVGIRIEPFEACSGFNRITTRRIAQPPKATFVTRLRPSQSPSQTARQLPDPSTIIRVEPSSTRETRLQGAHGDTLLFPQFNFPKSGLAWMSASEQLQQVARIAARFTCCIAPSSRSQRSRRVVFAILAGSAIRPAQPPGTDMAEIAPGGTTWTPSPILPVIDAVRAHVGGRGDAIRHVEKAGHGGDVPDVAIGKA